MNINTHIYILIALSFNACVPLCGIVIALMRYFACGGFCPSVRACVCMYTFLCHCVNFHTHSIHNTTLEMENAREETQQQQEQQKRRKNGNTGNNKRSSTALSPSLSLSNSLSLLPCHLLSCRVHVCACVCILVTVFGFVSAPHHLSFCFAIFTAFAVLCFCLCMFIPAPNCCAPK